MATQLCGRSLVTLALLAVGGTLAGATPAVAQEKTDPAKKLSVSDYVRPSNLVVAGYATPGSPMSAKIKTIDGNILGGTVYYAVYRRTGRAGDAWGIRGNFDSTFVEGENIRRGVSPHLDSDAEYLYLYQVVNDRALHDPALNKKGAVIPGNFDPNNKYTRDIASFSLRLIVDPRYITSWGYFSETGFSLRVHSENQGKSDFTMAVSGHPSIADALPVKNYRPWAPSKRLDTGKTGFAVSTDTEGLGENPNLLKNKVTGVRFANYGETAKKGGAKPDYVQLLVMDTPTPMLDAARAVADEPARGIFRADWRKLPIPEGEHSVVFGFTSDLPPINQPIRIKDPEASAVAAAVGADVDREFRPVADDEAEGTDIAPAVGVGAGAVAIASPQMARDVGVAPPGGGVLTPLIGGGYSGFGGGSGGPLGGAVGAIGAARPSVSGGGGQLGGGGDQGGTQNQSQVPTITNTNNNTLTNQQQQAQLQVQIQAQVQAQLQNMFNNNGHGNVVPEPTGLLLGLFGLPGLWFIYRRKTAAA